MPKITKAGTRTFAPAVAQRALSRRGGIGVPTPVGSVKGSIKNIKPMPSGRTIQMPRGGSVSVSGPATSYPMPSKPRMGKGSKFQSGGSQMQGVARRALRRRQMPTIRGTLKGS